MFWDLQIKDKVFYKIDLNWNDQIYAQVGGFCKIGSPKNDRIYGSVNLEEIIFRLKSEVKM